MADNIYGDSAEGAFNRFIRGNYGESAWGLGQGAMNQYRGNLGGIVDQFNAAHPGSQARVAGVDKIDFGQGAIDVLTNGGQFTYGAPGRPGYGAPVNGGGNSNTGVTGAGGVPPATPATGLTGESSDLYNQLMKRWQTGPNLDPNNPVIKAQTDAFGATQERSRRNYLADAAEKGGPLVNQQGEQRMATERMAQANSGFQAELMGRELQQQRAEMSDYLKSMTGLLSERERNALQLQISQIDDATRRLGINTSANTAAAALGENARQYDKDLGYRYDKPQLDWMYGSDF